MPYITYILKSESTGKFYIGQTNNLEDRLRRHNRGYSKYTKNKGPWELYFHKKFKTRAEAVQCELPSKKNSPPFYDGLFKNIAIKLFLNLNVKFSPPV